MKHVGWKSFGWCRRRNRYIIAKVYEIFGFRFCGVRY